MGTFRGREEIRDWSVRTMTTYPGRVMTGFPLSWQVVDADAARLVCEVRNPMPDPGDGTMLEEPNITIMTYAGDGLFSRRGGRLQPAALPRDGDGVGTDRGSSTTVRTTTCSPTWPVPGVDRPDR